MVPLVAVRGNDWPPTNNGRVCVKGSYEHKVLDSPHVIMTNIVVVAEENRVMIATVVIYPTCVHYQAGQDNYCSTSRENDRPYSGRRISIVWRRPLLFWRVVKFQKGRGPNNQSSPVITSWIEK